jgi:Rrf2 family cysteine metabolism transcriptional repressor
MHVINRCTAYAILSLLHMASNGEVVSALELAEKLSIPHPFLRGILRTLKEHKIIRSRRGQNGGFILEKDPQKITLLELLTIFQGPVILTECSENEACPRYSVCALKAETSSVEKEIIRRFQEITIQSLLRRQ